MISLVEDFGPEEVSKTLEYYFRLNKDGHPLNWFYNNFSNINSARIQAEKDSDIREKQRKKTLELRAEYLNGIQ